MSESNTTAEAIFAAMLAMRAGRITADEYRATMRTIRVEVGESAFMVAKFVAVGMDR